MQLRSLASKVLNVSRNSITEHTVTANGKEHKAQNDAVASRYTESLLMARNCGT